MIIKRRSILAACLWAAGITGISLWGSAPAGERETWIQVLTDTVVLESKFDLLRQEASDRNVRIEVLRMDQAEDAAIVESAAQADFLVLDAPRESSFQAAAARLESLNAGGHSWSDRELRVGRTERWSRGLNEAQAERLWSYYRHGGRRNFAHFLDAVHALVMGNSLDGIPLPEMLPAMGAYHPRFGDEVDVDPKVVVNATRLQGSKGVIAIGFHPSYLESGDLRHIDALVEAVEARGAVAIPLFYSMGPEAELSSLVEGLALDVLLHTSPVYHLGLREQLDRLDVPAIQIIGWSEGNPDHYRKDPVGLSLNATPIYLAMPEQVGMIDPIVAFTRGEGRIEVIPEQIELAADKALAYVRLRSTPVDSRTVAVMVYNYPPGEKNISASFLNVPRSLEVLSRILEGAGYRTEERPESFWIDALGQRITTLHQPKGLLLELEENAAGRLSLETYLGWYATLSVEVRQRIEARWGPPEYSVYLQDGAFRIPLVRNGNLVVLAQPPRGEPAEDNERSLYHDMRVPVNHYYLATYLWVREELDADVLVHFGTHGTQEWMPGRERGLHREDDSFLALGHLPVVYPYIIDNVGEATQAKRRGRAVIVSHQTPAFRAAGLYGELNDLHHLVHQWEHLEPGEVRDRTMERLIGETLASEALVDFEWSEEVIRLDPEAFLNALHDHLHDIADMAQPIGLRTFGEDPEPFARVTTILQILGEGFFEALELDELDEVYTDLYDKVVETLPYRWVVSVLEGKPLPEPSLPEWEARVRQLNEDLSARFEREGLLRALEGRHLPVGIGGDPIRVPESLPSGRNLYGFDPSSIPTREAWETGRAVFEELLQAHIEENGEPLRKIAFSLWAVEAMRHGGVLESQALYAMGLRPVWNERGRVVSVEMMPREELGRPRVDVVLSATGLYRDQFPNLMEHLAKGAAAVAALDEEDNPSFEHSQRLIDRLLARGIERDEAEYLAGIRLFGSPTGVYGTGLEDAAMASDTWEDDGKLAELYLRRMSHAFGPDPSRWEEGESVSDLYAANLEGVEAAFLARTSNLYGLLTTDDPFQYLGGISLAVRHVSGKSPALYIANQRKPGAARIESAARFLSQELQTRAFHPGWIEAMQAEGYAGALNLQDLSANLWGWQVVDPAMVTGGQWQRMHDVYVRDVYNLEMRSWFESHQPEALLRIVERMLEANRKEYWQADTATLSELVETWTSLSLQFDLAPGNSAIAHFVDSVASGAGGFGLGPGTAPAAASGEPPLPAPMEPPPPAEQSGAPVTVSGQQLRLVESAASPPPSSDQRHWWALLLLVPILLGGLRQMIRRS